MATEKNKQVIVLSINPKYAHAILKCQKTVEFRRNGVPSSISNIVIYSTKPDQQVLGYCDVIECVVDTPESLWQKYGHCGGITYTDFMNYYDGYDKGKCYLIDNPRRFKSPIPLEKCKSFSTAPQSFVYLDKKDWKNLKRKKVQDTDCDPECISEKGLNYLR
jgi:predicted transcriptional regulator